MWSQLSLRTQLPRLDPFKCWFVSLVFEILESKLSVVQAFFDLENGNQELKSDLKDLYINGAVCVSSALFFFSFFELWVHLVLSNLKKKILFCAGRWTCLPTGRLLSSMFHTGYKSLTRRFMWGLFGSLRRSSVGRWENNPHFCNYVIYFLKHTSYVLCPIASIFLNLSSW